MVSNISQLWVALATQAGVRCYCYVPYP